MESEWVQSAVKSHVYECLMEKAEFYRQTAEEARSEQAKTHMYGMAAGLELAADWVLHIA